MGKLHKDIGLVIVQSAENADRTDGQIIKVRVESTHDILTIHSSVIREGVSYVFSKMNSVYTVNMLL